MPGQMPHILQYQTYGKNLKGKTVELQKTLKIIPPKAVMLTGTILEEEYESSGFSISLPKWQYSFINKCEDYFIGTTA